MYILIIFVCLQPEDNTGRGDREASLVPETVFNLAEGTTVMARTLRPTNTIGEGC